jgi:hypothetical protein
MKYLARFTRLHLLSGQTWARRNRPHDLEDSPEKVGSATASLVAKVLAGQIR